MADLSIAQSTCSIGVDCAIGMTRIAACWPLLAV
jgi:hypothetical protein